jgi:3-oxocholest-4-en-26-oate---CoA ligase
MGRFGEVSRTADPSGLYRSECGVDQARRRRLGGVSAFWLPLLTPRLQVSPAVFCLAGLHEAIATAHPDRECLIWRDRRLTWREVSTRSGCFAALLRTQGLGMHVERSQLLGSESGQDMVGLFLRNSPAYLEAMLGAYKARCAPFNINYRYTATELRFVLDDAAASVLVYDADFEPVVRQALTTWPEPPLLVRVASTSATPAASAGEEPWSIAVDYEDALAGCSAWLDPRCDPDDLYVLYTGGTTGQPKGVLWRQGDFLVGALGFTATDVAEVVRRSASGDRLRVLPTAPLMHGAAHWNAWSAWLGGGTVVLQSDNDRLDPVDVWDTVERERVTSLQLVGDAFALPLLAELERRRSPTSLRFVLSGGASLSARNKQRFLAALPGARVVDIVGSSEAGRQLVHTAVRPVDRPVSDVATKDATSSAAGDGANRFDPSEGSVVLDEHRTRPVDAGSGEIGWLASRGAVPLGYLGDEERTAHSFPTVEGVRYSVPGDRARIGADGRIELLGRDSVTINTGGEKVFAEEVEAALKSHPCVLDALVVGRASARWGQEVVAVVALRDDGVTDADDITDAELLTAAAEHLARYKLPKLIVRRPAVQRHASGKPDYVWARQQVE